MARVNVEDRFFGEERLNKFSKFMGWTRREAIGCLVLLWHESQGQKTGLASFDDIVDWCCEDESEGQKLISQLVRWKYISAKKGGKLFEIDGNKKQIKNLISYKKRGEKGGKATKEKWKRAQTVGPQEVVGKGTSPSNSPSKRGHQPQPSQAHYNTIQDNTIHNTSVISCGGSDDTHAGEPQDFKLGQESKKQTPKKGQKVKVVSDSTRVWNAFSEAYKIRYGVEPVRNAKTNGQVAQLLTRLPKEDCPNLVRFFVAHHDQFYLRKGHDIGLCLQDSQSLYTQMRQGKIVTSTTARVNERDEGNMQAMNDFLREKQRRAEGS